MAELTIILRRDPQSGKQNIVVKLDSDPDSLPIEHEQLHKKLVEKLVGQGIKAEDLGEVVIEREGTVTPVGDIQTRDEGEREKVDAKR
jgi:hypothetical protein